MPKPSSSGRFQLLSGKRNYRMIIRSWGQDKTGKNHFGYTGPGPIFGQYLDPGGHEGVAEKFINGEIDGTPRQIQAVQYRFDKTDMSQDQAVALRDEFITDFEVAIQAGRLIQWDETETWELFRWAEFGGESDAPKNYGALNARYRKLIQAAYDAGCNLQLIQKVKERWATGPGGKGLAPTGIFEPMGFKECNYVVQINLEHSWSKEDGFGIKVVNCRQNATLNGEEFSHVEKEESRLDWSTLGQMVFPSSSSEDWQ